MTGSGNLGHGTATGSVAASPASHRVTGAAPKAELIPLRALRSVVRFEQSRVAAAVDHARRNGAHVITMSLGGVPSSAMRAAIRKAVAQNIIVLAAAGNCVGSVVWPARYGEVIAVGGHQRQGPPVARVQQRAQRRCRGPGGVRLARGCLATPPIQPRHRAVREPPSPRRFLRASPPAGSRIMGADALIAGLSHGETLQTRFRRLLRDTARVPPGFDTDRYGAGIVDADAFIAADPVAAGVEEAVTADLRSVEREIREFSQDGGAGRGRGRREAVGDPASVLELACVALDMARAAPAVRPPRSGAACRPVAGTDLRDGRPPSRR